MKKKTIFVPNENVEETILEMSYFSYRLVKQQKGKKSTKLYFLREVELSDELKAIEERYFAILIPSFKPVVIMTVITLILLTTLLVCFVSLRGTPYDDILFYTFGGLSLLSFIILTVIFYVRLIRINRNVRESKDIKEELNKVKEQELALKEKEEE